jgi:hypothetical protein
MVPLDIGFNAKIEPKRKVIYRNIHMISDLTSLVEISRSKTHCYIIVVPPKADSEEINPYARPLAWKLNAVSIENNNGNLS